MEHREHPLSWDALVRVTVAGVAVFLCWKALAVFPVILIALVLAISAYPIIKKAEARTNMPFVLSLVLILVAPIIVFVFLGFIFVPKIVAEIPVLLRSLDAIVGHGKTIPALLRNLDIAAYIHSHFDYTAATVHI